MFQPLSHSIPSSLVFALTCALTSLVLPQVTVPLERCHWNRSNGGIVRQPPLQSHVIGLRTTDGLRVHLLITALTHFKMGLK